MENVLFRVPRHPFETESEVFRDMFALPLEDDSLVSDGSSDEKPLILDGIAANNFRALLKALMNP